MLHRLSILRTDYHAFLLSLILALFKISRKTDIGFEIAKISAVLW